MTISRCVTIQRGHDLDVVADTYIKPNALRVNFGAKPVFRVSASDEALLRFEIGSIPRSAVITKATLQLFANGEAGDGTIRVHRVTAPWAEADVTYASFKQSFASEPVAALRIERRTTQKSVDVASVVASWVSGAKPNYGLELDTGPDHHAKCDRPGDDDRDPTLFVSSEDVAAARRPALEVCYSTTVDECTANPCHNGGTCKNASSGYRCACAPGFSGPTCDKRLDPCLANPCQHGASCTSTPSSYACVCPAGFSGTHCETNTDDCASLPCQHGGVCSDGIASYSCACAPGYDGVNCEHALDNCADSPCHNGGACANLATRFACTCLSGFSGPTCDTNIDDCAGRPCVNGTCVDGVASFSCACGPDWGGARCDVNLNSCAQAPCLNGGTCTNAPGAYSCACARGYTGANCEIDVNDCAPNPCSNGGMCVDGIASYSCMCPAGYVGTNCETAVPAPERVRINGECFALCQSDSDPDGDGWGYEQDACVMPSNPLSTSSPWCDTPVSPAAYEAPHASVDDSTTSVATIPRPPRLEIAPPLDCPYASAGLLPWNPAWLTADGTIDLPAGVRVLVRGNDDIPSTTLVRHLHVPTTSELVFADQPATFRISDVLIDGALRLGSATCRLESAIRFEFDTDEDVSRPAVRSAIYDRMGLGIMVGPSGVLEMFGHLQQPTWTRLAATASAGNSQLLLAEAVDWQPGQQIVIATSARVDYPMHDGNELRTITRVQNGKTVLLDRPLDSPHYGGSEYQVEAGLLSHNLLFRTADRVLAAAPTFGGHIMVHSKNARVSGVELYGMGQQNFLARYPFHFHLAGDVAGAGYLTDSSIWRSNWRCAVVHRTDHAIVSRNVAYDNFGHCYYLEDGVEMNNELSFNLAVKTKIMGPTDQASIDAMRALGQPGFTLTQSPDLVQPADRAAAGFYISNGNNRIIGNAASGGFTGFSLPNLPRALGGSVDRIFPIQYGVSDFDGNTAHSAGYLWGDGACIYVGGTLLEVGGQLQYTSGRSTEWDLLRHQTEVFNNTKTFLCEQGITHWGNNPRIVNFEAWDNGLLGRLFGAASVQSALVVAQTGNSLPVARPISGFERGFQFYDTRNQTILKDVTFRGFHHDSYGDTWTDRLKEWDSCALLSMTH
ncbi:MAG TPA: DNRLRE domain-containing protein, partial [Polyangiaceae bacterium]